MPAPQDLQRAVGAAMEADLEAAPEEAAAAKPATAKKSFKRLRAMGRVVGKALAAVHRALNPEPVVNRTASADPVGKTQAEHEAEVRQAFSLYDQNGDGTIDTLELRAVLQAMGINATKPEVEELMAQMDTDGNGTIDFNEFAAVMQNEFTVEEAQEAEKREMRQLFRILDRDGSGKLSVDELQEAIGAMGVAMTREEVEYLVTRIDENGDGEVEFNEFMNFLFTFSADK